MAYSCWHMEYIGDAVMAEYLLQTYSFFPNSRVPYYRLALFLSSLWLVHDQRCTSEAKMAHTVFCVTFDVAYMYVTFLIAVSKCLARSDLGKDVVWTTVWGCNSSWLGRDGGRRGGCGGRFWDAGSHPSSQQEIRASWLSPFSSKKIQTFNFTGCACTWRPKADGRGILSHSLSILR